MSRIEQTDDDLEESRIENAEQEMSTVKSTESEGEAVKYAEHDRNFCVNCFKVAVPSNPEYVLQRHLLVISQINRLYAVLSADC